MVVEMHDIHYRAWFDTFLAITDGPFFSGFIWLSFEKMPTVLTACLFISFLFLAVSYGNKESGNY